MSTIKTEWPIGTPVKFTWDGLTSQGIVRAYGTDWSALIVIDKNKKGGWDIDDYVISKYPELQGYAKRRGWHVNFSALQHTKTKLGNEL